MRTSLDHHDHDTARDVVHDAEPASTPGDPAHVSPGRPRAVTRDRPAPTAPSAATLRRLMIALVTIAVVIVATLVVRAADRSGQASDTRATTAALERLQARGYVTDTRTDDELVATDDLVARGVVPAARAPVPTGAAVGGISGGIAGGTSAEVEAIARSHRDLVRGLVHRGLVPDAPAVIVIPYGSSASIEQLAREHAASTDDLVARGLVPDAHTVVVVAYGSSAWVEQVADDEAATTRRLVDRGLVPADHVDDLVLADLRARGLVPTGDDLG